MQLTQDYNRGQNSDQNEEHRTQLLAKVKNCAEYIENIYRGICFYPDELEVKYKMHEFAHFIIMGNKRDDGVLIGRSGSTIQSIRHFIHAYSKMHLEGLPCIVEVKDHGQSRYNPVTITRSGPYRRR